MENNPAPGTTIEKNASHGCPVAATERISNRILVYIRKKLLAKYGTGKPLRAFHAKSIGLVEAKIQTDPDLPENLREGIFKEYRDYKAWVRFSNGSGSVSADKKKGVRGMAIKILDVQGSRVPDPDPEGNTQDIILFTSPVHIPAVPAKQVLVPVLVLGNIFEKIIAFLRALPIRLRRIIQFLKGSIRTPNILEVTYYSATPFAFGKQAVKWQVRPLNNHHSPMPGNPTNDYLRERLKQDLSVSGETVMGLFVQFRENEETEPIEDTSVEWKTPFYRVATIHFPKQDFDTPERKLKDLNMSFSPGHAVTDHAPLGQINQVRRIVYQQLGKERMEHP